jgi:hypothetical protein
MERNNWASQNSQGVVQLKKKKKVSAHRNKKFENIIHVARDKIAVERKI